MSAEATDAPDLPGSIPAMPAARSLSARAEQVASAIERAVREAWTFLRFLFFVVYLLIAVVSFWLWAVAAVIGVVRFALRALMLSLLWLSGGAAPRPGPPAPNMATALQAELRYLWDERLAAYDDVARPIARNLLGARRATRTFWHWSFPKKALSLVAIGAFVIVPGLYVVPRPNEVQITDDNAVEYDKITNKTTYLVHALDLHIDGKHREYLNEDAWYFGKINSQGLKSQLQIGRTYRLWVVGIRWYYMPTLYPNIISATEIDTKGNVGGTSGAAGRPGPGPRRVPGVALDAPLRSRSPWKCSQPSQAAPAGICRSCAIVRPWRRRSRSS